MLEQLRLAALMASISLATDLGMGQPLEQALRTCLLATGLGERLGLHGEELSDVYYVALLRFLGCTADAHETAALTGDDIAFRAAVAPVFGAGMPEFMRGVAGSIGAGDSAPRRAARVAVFMTRGAAAMKQGVASHCEVGEGLARRIGLPEGVRHGLSHAFERWDGGGFPGGVKGEAIALPARVVVVARDAEVLDRALGPEAAVDAIRRRSTAGTYDPSVAAAFSRHGGEVLDRLQGQSVWDAVLAAEPEPHPWVPASRLDGVLEAFADFIDLKSVFTAGHSRGVAQLVEGDLLRRAALVHDLGRASVPTSIWDKPGPLSIGERERVRLHAYYSERILRHSRVLEPLAELAGMHHERLDGSGYHRGCRAPEIPAAARRLAAADAYQAMTQPRPQRPALAPDAAAAELEKEAAAGRLDAEAVAEILTAAGHRRRVPRREWPAGLTEREVDVLRLVARGASKKEVGRDLHISPSTADHHLRHIYDKTGVRSRAGLTLYAIEADLLAI